LAPSAEGEVATALARAWERGVTRAVVIGTDAETSQAALDLVAANPGPVELFATVGLHPHDATQGLDEVAAIARKGGPGLVGIGECGLDYFYEHSPRKDQRQVFATQIALAHELRLALVIHARDAWEDLWSILGSEGVPERTVIHCFTGGPAEAEGCLALGCDISLSGIVTFKNAQPTRDALATIPLERLHVETDSPFLAPVPHRGQPNEPAYVAIVGEAVATLLGSDPADLRAATFANTARLFGLPTN
jgi:TatD DNase family protein